MRLRPPSTGRDQSTVRPSPARPDLLRDSTFATPPLAPDTSTRRDAPAPRRSRRRTAVLVTVLLLLAAGAAAALLLTMPQVESTAPVRATNDPAPELQVRIQRPLGVDASAVRASIDGEPLDDPRVTVRDDGALVLVQAPRLDDGEHRAQVSIGGVGVLQRTLDTEWTFTVDTVAPTARIVAPAVDPDSNSPYLASGTVAVTKLPLRVVVAAERGSVVRVDSDRPGVRAQRSDEADVDRRSVELDLPQGAQQVVVTARDSAGNVTERRQAVLVDTVGPRTVLRGARTVRDASLALPIVASDPHGVELAVSLDGHEQPDAIDVTDSTDAPAAGAGAGGSGDSTSETTDSTGSAPAAAGCDSTEQDDDSCPDALPVEVRGTVTLDEPAYEGRHALQVTATDSLGSTRTVTRTVIVDSGETLNDVTGLRPGAHGADVIELHDALVKAEVATRAQLAADARTRTYGDATRRAVAAYQSQHGMDADGIAGPDTIAGLTLRIVVDRSTKTLTLYRNGSVVKTWGVAVGSPEYPTPAGDFRIQSMQQDPTWTPPDSPWAKDAKPIGPGPDNPLGTRWMAINGTVGIHGTNNPSSIGYSVSHGCIRMRIPDVEELFDMVSIGTPVSVV